MNSDIPNDDLSFLPQKIVTNLNIYSFSSAEWSECSRKQSFFQW